MDTVAIFLFRSVIVPTRIQLLLLELGVMADLIQEGILLLLASGLVAVATNILTYEVKVVRSLARSRNTLLEAMIGIFRSISLALDARDLLRDKAERV